METLWHLHAHGLVCDKAVAIPTHSIVPTIPGCVVRNLRHALAHVLCNHERAMCLHLAAQSLESNASIQIELMHVCFHRLPGFDESKAPFDQFHQCASTMPEDILIRTYQQWQTRSEPSLAPMCQHPWVGSATCAHEAKAVQFGLYRTPPWQARHVHSSKENPLVHPNRGGLEFSAVVTAMVLPCLPLHPQL